MADNHRDELREKAQAHLQDAHGKAGAPALQAFGEHLSKGELEAAADELAKHAEQRPDLAGPFWSALASAYEGLGLTVQAERSRARA